MTTVPRPKPRPYNPEHDYTVRVGELPVAWGVGSHLVITGHDPDGNQLWEFNGFAAGPDHEAKTVGLPWDSSDTIRVYFDPGPEGWHGHNLRNQRAVRWGSLDDINEFRRVAHATGDLINHLNLPYRFDTTNSNATVAELLRAGHVDPNVLFRYGGFKGLVPGYQTRLLKPGLY